MTRKSPTAGVIYVEFLVAIVPVLTIFWGILQINGMLLADLVIQHAAMDAVRAAVVCDSDSNVESKSQAEAAAVDCATRAAQTILRAVKSFDADGVRVTISGAAMEGSAPVTAFVSATYRCQVPLVGGLACGATGSPAPTSGQANLQAQATFPNQGHYYHFKDSKGP